MRLLFVALTALSLAGCTMRGHPDDWGAIAVAVGKIILSNQE